MDDLGRPHQFGMRALTKGCFTARRGVRKNGAMTPHPPLEEVLQHSASYADGKLLAGRIGHIGIVLLNQPEKRNALSLAMWDGLCVALEKFAEDAQIRVVVYAGAGGKAFTAGADISEFATKRNSAEANVEYKRITDRGAQCLRTFAKPTIACIQGFCMGGGLNFAMQADLRVSSSDAVYAIPAARMGIAYGVEPMEKLVSLIGPARARLMLYTARRFSAPEAIAMGLTDVLAEDAVRASLELAESIAQNAPLAIATARQAIEQVLQEPSKRDANLMNEYTRRCMNSHDFQEGRTAFMERRKPVFTGA